MKHGFLGRITRRYFRPATKQEFLHFGFEEGAVFGVEGGQAVFVDEHGLMCQPFLPGVVADIGEYALAEFAGPGDEGEAVGLLLFVLAEDGAGHRAVHFEQNSKCTQNAFEKGVGKLRPVKRCGGQVCDGAFDFYGVHGGRGTATRPEATSQRRVTQAGEGQAPRRFNRGHDHDRGHGRDHRGRDRHGCRSANGCRGCGNLPNRGCGRECRIWRFGA